MAAPLELYGSLANLEAIMSAMILSEIDSRLNSITPRREYYECRLVAAVIFDTVVPT